VPKFLLKLCPRVLIVDTDPAPTWKEAARGCGHHHPTGY